MLFPCQCSQDVPPQHFFRGQIGEDKGIVAKYISTKEQQADIFTKGLPEAQFQAIRKLLIGW